MVEIICEYVVKEEARGHFELTFGPGGPWSKLFSNSPGFRGTTVLRDTEDPGRYLIVDIWRTPTQREQALAEYIEQYNELMTRFDDWTDTITELGSFRILSEGTVRARGRSARTETSVTRRRNKRR